MTETAKETKTKGMKEILDLLHNEAKREWPEFGVGDTIKVHYKIIEGDKKRIQVYEGTVIAIQNEGFSKTFTVRRVSHEVGVERIFPWHSPSIDKIEVVRKGKVRRAKLYYLRHKSGKAGRIKESREGQIKMIAEQKAAKAKAKAEKEAAKLEAKKKAEAEKAAKEAAEKEAAEKAAAEDTKEEPVAAATDAE